MLNSKREEPAVSRVTRGPMRRVKWGSSCPDASGGEGCSTGSSGECRMARAGQLLGQGGAVRTTDKRPRGERERHSFH